MKDSIPGSETPKQVTSIDVNIKLRIEFEDDGSVVDHTPDETTAILQNRWFTGRVAVEEILEKADGPMLVNFRRVA